MCNSFVTFHNLSAQPPMYPHTLGAMAGPRLLKIEGEDEQNKLVLRASFRHTHPEGSEVKGGPLPYLSDPSHLRYISTLASFLAHKTGTQFLLTELQKQSPLSHSRSQGGLLANRAQSHLLAICFIRYFLVSICLYGNHICCFNGCIIFCSIIISINLNFLFLKLIVVFGFIINYPTSTIFVHISSLILFF